MSLSLLFTFLILAVGLLIAHPLRAHEPITAPGVPLTNKVVPDVIRCEAETALGYFPELADARIVFRFKNDIRNSLMQAQPRGFFHGRSGRSYVINISEQFFFDHGTSSMKEIPSEVLIGWLVHELGHIMDYRERSSMGLVIFGFKYVTSHKYLKQAERAADIYAVEGGCGDHLVKCKEFILRHDELPDAYKEKIKRSYLSPDAIMDMLQARDAAVKE